jgi:hypothetical protein
VEPSEPEGKVEVVMTSDGGGGGGGVPPPPPQPLISHKQLLKYKTRKRFFMVVVSPGNSSTLCTLELHPPPLPVARKGGSSANTIALLIYLGCIVGKRYCLINFAR